MSSFDIDVGLTDEEREVRDLSHKFAEEVLRPAGVELDRLQDPADVIASDSVLWKVFDRYRELGLGDLEAGAAEADPIVSARIRYLVNEEIGWGDSGLAVSLGVLGFPTLFARLSGSPELIERFASPQNREIGCWAVTEPDHGSDSLAFDQPQFADPKIRANCIATKDGHEYVIRGQKAAWVSNGSIATVATLFCTIDPSQGFRGGGVALVPLDLPGVSRGVPLDKLGQRALNQGEIFFDDVRIPAEYMVVGTDAYSGIVEMVLTTANAYMGTTFVGVARAAYEHALAYSRERVQGGVPIFQHQNVKAKLFRMFSQVEAARSLARRVLLYNSTQPPQIQYSIASKTFCTQTAFEVASQALQIFGGNGLSREYPIEKLLRDARASMIEDGCNDILALVGAEKL
ncbi:MAG: acyl-CoA/acyl-ACP dehydrogenase [Deltaproteobacteria bacterium]|nr:acyl-CoA/acyl-ACP dehydrogenase [Deltaproteobacteria bacterium]MBW2696772.1 acyl-CoA/acyl-ACP dehydrogenase [Deltaproteobacteria bacterium]